MATVTSSLICQVTAMGHVLTIRYEPLVNPNRCRHRNSQSALTPKDRTLRGDGTLSNPPKWYKESLKLTTLKIQQMQGNRNKKPFQSVAYLTTGRAF